MRTLTTLTTLAALGFALPVLIGQVSAAPPFGGSALAPLSPVETAKGGHCRVRGVCAQRFGHGTPGYWACLRRNGCRAG